LGKTLLYIDDNEVYSTLMCNLLNTRGFQTDYAPTLLSARQFLKTHKKPDIVILDYSLQEGSTGEFAKSLRTLLPGTVIIMVSGRVERGDNIETLVEERVADDYIRKPFDVRQLSAVIISCLEKRGLPSVCPEGSPPEQKTQK
jgi:DNA-binding response OmpR family regulator